MLSICIEEKVPSNLIFNQIQPQNAIKHLYKINLPSQPSSIGREVAQLCLTLCDPMDCSPPGSCVHGDPPGKNTGVGCHFLLQGIFPTQGQNPGLLHCRWIFYHLSHQRSTRLLKFVAYPFSRGPGKPNRETKSEQILLKNDIKRFALQRTPQSFNLLKKKDNIC